MSEDNINQYYQNNIDKIDNKGISDRRSAELYYQSVQQFLVDKQANNKFLLKFGWIVAGCLLMLSIIEGVALIVLIPLKTAIPYVMRVDNNTGFVDIAKPLADSKTTYDEIMSKFWLKTYIINRESYDWETIADMYSLVQLHSNSIVFTEYSKIVQADTSALKVLKMDKKVVVNVISITFIENFAQVRFSKVVKERNGEIAQGFTPTFWLATVYFDFDKSIKTEKERMSNPLGFQVTNYRVDIENVKN